MERVSESALRKIAKMQTVPGEVLKVRSENRKKYSHPNEDIY